MNESVYVDSKGGRGIKVPYKPLKKLSGGKRSYPTSDIKRRSKLTLKEQIEKYIKHIGKQSTKYEPGSTPPAPDIAQYAPGDTTKGYRKGDMVKGYANGGGVRPAENEYS
jgi:hypothetical protein